MTQNTGFDDFEPAVRPIVARMLFEFEIEQSAQLFFLRLTCDSDGVLQKIRICRRRTSSRIALPRRKVVFHCVCEQRKPVIEQRRRCAYVVAVVVDQQPKVPEVTIRVQNDGVKDDHIRKTLIIFVSEFTIILCYVVNISLDKTAGRNIRQILVCKDLASRTKSSLPFGKIVFDSVNVHAFRDLCGIVFAIGLVPRVCETFRA